MRDKNINFIRDNYLHKELESYANLIEALQTKEVELELVKRKWENKKRDYKRMLD